MDFEVMDAAECCFYNPDDKVTNEKVAGAIVQSGDYSFMETLMALLCDRECEDCYNSRKNNKNIYLKLYNAIYSFEAPMFEAGIADVTSIQMQSLHIFKVSGFYAQENKFVIPEGFEPLKDFRLFLKQKGVDAMLLVNKQAMKSIVVIDVNPTMKTWHYIQAAIPRLLPWFFVDKPLTTSEKALLASADKDYNTYLECLNKLAKEKNILENKIRASLQHFKKNRANHACDIEEEKLDELRTQLRNLESQYRSLLDQIEKQNNTVFALRWKAENTEDNDDLIRIFTNSPNLKFEYANESGGIGFYVDTTLDNFDPDMFDKNNRYFASSYRVDGADVNFWTPERRVAFLGAIFNDDPVIKIRILSRFSIQTQGFVNPLEVRDDARCKDHLPNAHLEYYGCLGNNEMTIEKLLRDGDIAMAIMQCVSAAASQNILEQTTASHLFRDLFKSCEKVIQTPDGNMTPKDAYTWLVYHKYIDEEV